MSVRHEPGSGKGRTLLCLDGGGVRGISALYIIKRLMESINFENPPKPCNYFDMICGCSTGGLIAIMLGRLQMTVDECIAAYKMISPKIFTKVRHRMSLKGKIQGRFDHVALEEAVKDLLRKGGLNEDELLRSQIPEMCKTFVCTTSKQSRNTVNLSSYPSLRRGRDLYDVTTIWQAARATCAATSFFEPIKIGDEEFIDGATPSNNPINELWYEAHDVFCDSSTFRSLEGEVACVVSVGTGIPSSKPFTDDPLKIGATLIKIATDSERRAEDFSKLHPRLCSEGRYFRFNVDTGLQGIGLEEEGRINEIISATRGYLQSELIYQRLTKCANILSTQQEIARNYTMATCISERSSIRSLQKNSDKLRSTIDVNPRANSLAWFTNTDNYKRWAMSEGGCLFYPLSPQTEQGFGGLLTGTLPASWRSHAQFDGDQVSDVRVAFADCREYEIRGVKDVLHTLVCQTLVIFYPTLDHWLRRLEKVSPPERRGMGSSITDGDTQDLYTLASSILSAKRHDKNSMSNQKILYVIDNIHYLSKDDTPKMMVQLRAEMERLGVHVLLIGETKLRSSRINWGSEDFLHVDEETEYKECLASLKFDDMYTRRNQVAAAFDGTTQWVGSHSGYRRWNQRTSGILWIRGKPGSGKSVLAKSILSSSNVAKDCLIASWFYSKRGGTIGMSHLSMMRSICFQLMSQNKRCFEAQREVYREGVFDEKAFERIMEALAKTKTLPTILLLLDGLDESADRDKQTGLDVLHLFARITEMPGSGLKVIVLSRPYRSIEQVYGTYDILLEAENTEDISRIIDHGLTAISTALRQRETRESSAFGRKRLQELEPEAMGIISRTYNAEQEKEIENIRSFLTLNARGVILWVRLCIDQAIRYIKKGPITWQLLHNMLSRLPLELHEMYQTIITELSEDCLPEHVQMGRKILAWVITASTNRPLLLKELWEALGIPSSWPAPAGEYPLTDYIRENRPVFPSWPQFGISLYSICGPLVEIVNPSDSGSFQYDRMSKVTGRSVVHLVHQTAKEFLEGFQDNIFFFEPLEAQETVFQDAEMYLRLALPLFPTEYAPELDDISNDWKNTVIDVLEYLDNKYLFPYILSHCPVSEEYIQRASSNTSSKWMLTAFFNDMSYRDINVPGVLEETVVGWSFTAACRLGLQGAIDNLLYLTSMRPGWWAVHRQAVLKTALHVAQEHELAEMTELLERSQYLFDRPAVQRHGHLDDKASLHRSIRRSMRPQAFNGESGMMPRILPSSLHLPLNPDKSSANEAIQRIAHYLSGNMQPLGLQATMMSWKSQQADRRVVESPERKTRTSSLYSLRLKLGSRFSFTSRGSTD